MCAVKEVIQLKLRIIEVTSGVCSAYLAGATPAFASTIGGSLPWDAPLQTLAADLTGPVATSISLIALFVAGAVLVFGEDLSHFARRVLVMIIAIAFLVLGAKFLSALSLTGATV
jgi:type IV secretory pathway VirB2 component (pilin)